MDIQIFQQIPGYLGWKDTKHRFMGSNDNFIRLLGINRNKLIGLKDEDLCDHTPASSKFHKENDELALRGEEVHAIHKSEQPYDGSYYYLVKKPLLCEKGSIIGVIFHCQILKTSKTMMAQLTSDYQRFQLKNYRLTNHANPKKLSRQELSCLFHLLRGKRAKEIAHNMNLSSRTVESYIENIKVKFNCNTKNVLIVQAYELGYLEYLPR